MSCPYDICSFEASCIVLPTDLTSCIEKSQRILSQPHLNLLLTNSNQSCLLLQRRSRFRFSSSEWLLKYHKILPSSLMTLQTYVIREERDSLTWFRGEALVPTRVSLSVSILSVSGFFESIDGVDRPRPNKSHCTSHQPCPSCWTITHADNQSRDQNRTEKCNLPHAVSQAASISDLQVRLPGLRSG